MNRGLKLLFVLAGIYSTSHIPAQVLTVGAGANLFVQSNAVLAVDNLVLTPSVDWNLTGPNAVSRTTTVTHQTANPYIQRVYQFSNTSPVFTGNITIYYLDAELNGIPENQLTLNIHNGIFWNAYTTGITRDAASNFVATAGVGPVTMNELTLAHFNSPLPVNLTAFNVQVINCIAHLKWTTAFEQNSHFFEVQQSADGINFIPVGTVAASGNTNSISHYIFQFSLAVSQSYFRLRMVDRDGASRFSNIVRLDRNCPQMIQVFPNPVKNKIRLTGLSIASQLELLNKLGQLILVVDTNGPEHSLDLSGLPAGSYIFRVRQNGQVLRIFKLIKE